MSSAAKARREDKNKNYAQVMQEFANDSVIFFNKCSKPDKNGKSAHPQAEAFPISFIHANPHAV